MSLTLQAPRVSSLGLALAISAVPFPLCPSSSSVSFPPPHPPYIQQHIFVSSPCWSSTLNSSLRPQLSFSTHIAVFHAPPHPRWLFPLPRIHSGELPLPCKLLLIPQDPGDITFSRSLPHIRAGRVGAPLLPQSPPLSAVVLWCFTLWESESP